LSASASPAVLRRPSCCRNIAPALGLQVVVKRLVLGFVLLLALPASAQGATWEPAGVIARTSTEELPFTATVDRAGDALFAWSAPGSGLFSRARVRGGALDKTETLRPDHVDRFELAENASGEAVMAWPEPIADSGQDTRREVVALRPPGGDFGAPQTLFEGVFQGGGSICANEAAISDNGTAMVVFSVFVPFDGCRLFAAVRRAGSAQFEQPVELAPAKAAAVLPTVAFDARGNALLAWGEFGEHGKTVETMRYLPNAGGFQPKQEIGIAGEELTGKLAGPLLLRVSGPTGAAIITYPSYNPATGAKRIAAAIGSTRSGFGPVANLSARVSISFATPQALAAAAGADGTLAVAWRSGTNNHNKIQVARVGPGAESITSLDTNTLSKERAHEVALAIADDGRVTAAWTRFIHYPLPFAVETATGAPSEHFARTQRLSNNGSSLPDVATNTRGDQFLAWLEFPDRTRKRTVHWAMASRRDGHFGRSRTMSGERRAREVRLYRGRRGAMLGAISRSKPGDSSLSLLTYGER
jgi:hypothetical protein